MLLRSLTLSSFCLSASKYTSVERTELSQQQFELEILGNKSQMISKHFDYQLKSRTTNIMKMKR